MSADRLVPALPSLEDVLDGLDWDAFSIRNFPGRGRHDLQVISAYDAYTHARRRRRRRPPPRRLSIGLNQTIAHGRRRNGLAEPQRVVLTGARLGPLSERQRDGNLVGVP
jgi:hypothetical protein